MFFARSDILLVLRYNSSICWPNFLVIEGIFSLTDVQRDLSALSRAAVVWSVG